MEGNLGEPAFFYPLCFSFTFAWEASHNVNKCLEFEMPVRLPRAEDMDAVKITYWNGKGGILSGSLLTAGLDCLFG